MKTLNTHTHTLTQLKLSYRIPLLNAVLKARTQFTFMIIKTNKQTKTHAMLGRINMSFTLKGIKMLLCWKNAL